MQTQESKVASETIAPAAASKPKGPRLVIRVKITPEPPPAPARSLISARTLGLSVAVIVLLTLIGLGVSEWRDDAGSSTMSVAQTGTERPSSRPATETSPSSPDNVAAADVLSTAVAPLDAATPTSDSGSGLTSPINEVIPPASRSALQTITGTIRVVIRVDIDKAGTVASAASEIPGPSRYFERLSREAATQWTFTPTNADEPRSMLLRFHFKRGGVTAEATPPDR